MVDETGPWVPLPDEAVDALARTSWPIPRDQDRGATELKVWITLREGMAQPTVNFRAPLEDKRESDLEAVPFVFSFSQAVHAGIDV